MVKNLSHTLAYSLIALQEMNLAFKYPIMFWNCACLISDSGGAEMEDIEEDFTCEEEFNYDSGIIDFANEEDDDEEDEEEEKTSTKKKKTKTTNYGKIASAIGKIKSTGVNVTPPDINHSTYTFSPDIENNTIRYGMSGINKIGEDLIKEIIANRPYSSLDDFLNKVKINKPQVVNLIKSGAFDAFGDRKTIMLNYIIKVSDTKKRITLQNMRMLIDFGLIPSDYSFECKVYNFNKYLKKMKLDNEFYGLDEIALNFYESNFDMDNLIPTEKTESGFKIRQTIWDSIYQRHMDIIRPYVKAHNAELLESVNNRIIEDMWNKYCTGSMSKWEMDSVSFYSHPHELANIKNRTYGFSNFYDLPENPDIDKIIYIKGKQIPLFKIRRITGTVLDKDKNKKTVTLLTNDGVVTVKIFGPVFTHYDKQISEKGADGKKHVIEKSWLSRGNKIIVSGIRREDSFVAKKYSKTPWHLVELITSIDEDGYIKTQKVRYGEEEE